MSADSSASPGSKNRRQLPKVPATNKPPSSLLRSSTSATSLPSNSSRTTGKLERSISQETVIGASRLLNPAMPRVIVPQGTILENEGEDSCVTVAVRVRPFSERELKLGVQLAIRMHEKETTITSPEGVVRKFCYDYSFWSFDRLRGDYTDQDVVYSQIAAPLLDQAFQGYNTCLFAYGQTGSGKSYCIMGEADNTGIIPRFAEELFSRIDGTTMEEGSSFKIEISFYEIYNEKIHDLLASTNKKNRSHLRVREHPVMGPYVEDLSTYVASSFKDIEHWITLGNKYRATAATGMNERSSRSHSVFTILFTQMSLLEGEEHSKVSRINLIDLAGSERSAHAQTSGDRLKEGASINRSLHTLGKVISLLAEKATSKRKKVFIPYRDSTLTWLLKESLGGNSKTTMIATISPADLYHDESLSTLRYAHQARSIINVAKVNEDPSARIIRELRAEIERLTGLLGTSGAPLAAFPTGQLFQNNGSSQNSDMEELQKKLREAEKLMTECTRTWEERLLESERRKQEEAEALKKAGMSFKVDNKLPNLINLNEDPQLCEILVYALKEGVTSVGRQSPSSTCDIQLTGALVAASHCEIQNNNSIVIIIPKGEAQTYINGNLIVTSTTLHHGDRLVIGGDHYFRFNHPGESADRGSSLQRSSLHDDNPKSFEFAHNEFIQAQTARIEAEVEEARLKEREILMQEIQTMKQQAQHEFEQEKKVYTEKLSLLENELEHHEVLSKESAESSKQATIKIAELEEKNKRLEEETLTQRHLLQLEKLRVEKENEEMRTSKTRLIMELEQEKQRLETEVHKMQKLKETKATAKIPTDTSLRKGSELVQVSMLIQEANALSQALNKHLTFARDAVYTSDGDSITRVKLTNSSTGLNTIWDLGKFESRLVQMRELMQGGQDSESVCSSISTMSEDDPFFDSKDVWEESFSSPSRGTPSHRSSSIASWPMSPSSSSRPLLDLPLSIPRHLVDSLTATKQCTDFGSPASETSSITSEIGNYTNVFHSLPSIPSLCRERVNNLLMALNENHGGVAQDSVYQSILMSGWEVSKAAGDMSMFLKAPLVSQHNVPLCESRDFRQSSINLQTSLELLVNSFYHLSCPQQVPQSVDPDLSPQHHKLKLLDTIRVLTTHIVQVLECIDNEMESAIQNSIRSIHDTVENIFSLCGQLSLAECIVNHLCSKQPVQEDKAWKGQLPFKILGHFYSGQCEYTEAVLVNVAGCVELKAIGQHTEGASDVVNCVNQLLTAIVNLIQQVADTQDQMWPSAEDQDNSDYSSAPNAPSLNRVTEMLALTFKVLAHVVTLCNCAGMERIDCDQLVRCNTDTAGACTQLAASVLHVIKSSGCEQDVLTTHIQTLSREIMHSGKNLNHAAKRYRQHISYRMGMSMATGQMTLTNFTDDGVI